MNFIFYISAFIFILVFIIKKNTNAIITFLLVVMLFLIVIYPDVSIDAAKSGINLWINVIIPSLLPFFIINDMLVSLNFPDIVAKLFYKTSYRLFNTSGYGIYAFIMSIFSGYPSGAKIVSDLCKNKKINNSEGQLILTFSSTSGPLFMVGAVGTGMLLNPKAGYILLFSHILGALVNGIIFKHIIPNNDHVLYESSIKHDQIKAGKMFSNSILNSLKTIGLIGGYIILFSVIIALLDKTMIITNILNLILPNNLNNKSSIVYFSNIIIKSLFELSNGCKIISALNISAYIKMLILSFLLSFSGFSTILQVSSVTANTAIKMSTYVLSKISHGIISALLCGLLILIFPHTLQSFAMAVTNVEVNNYNIIITLLFVFIIISIVSIFKPKKN